MINNIVFWTSISIPVGYYMSKLINDTCLMLYKKEISNTSKCVIITSIIFCGYLKGYTGNDLVTNIYESMK